MMEPGYLCSNLLHKLRVRPGLGKPAHVLQIPGRESLHIREFMHQVRRQPVDNPGLPLLLILPDQDVISDLPIEVDEWAGYRQGCRDLYRTDPVFQSKNKFQITFGEIRCL